MAANKPIVIFSRAVRTGKTTALQRWTEGRENIGGILTPDEHGMRKLLDIASGKKYDLQADEHFTGETITIGRFVFNAAVMERAKQLLHESLNRSPVWLVIDEVGKLEVEQHAGLEPAVIQIIHHYQSGRAEGRLLLVIRDSLLEKAIEKYGLQNAEVYTSHLPVL